MQTLLRFTFLICLFLQGCQTPGYYITDSTLPLAETRKTVSVIIGPPRQVSVNGRELYSAYHDHQFKAFSDDALAATKSRYFTKVLILGARRPYEINVQVWNEKYENQTRAFVTVGLDDGLSQARAIEIKRALNYSLEKQHTIDGENPF